MFIELDVRGDGRTFVNTRYIDSFWVDGKGCVHVTTAGSDGESWAIETPIDEFIKLLEECYVDVEVLDNGKI